MNVWHRQIFKLIIEGSNHDSVVYHDFLPPKKIFFFIPTPYFRPRGASEVKKAYFTLLAEPFADGTFLKFYGNDLVILIFINSKEVPTRSGDETF